MNYKRAIAAGVVAGIVALIIGIVINMPFTAEYGAVPQLWKPMDASWYYALTAFDILVWTLFAAVFAIFYNGIPGQGIRKGINYGIVLWFIATLPGMGMTFISMAVPGTLIAVWVIAGLVANIIGGAILGKLYRE